MKLRSLMTAICVLAAANIVYAAPFAYVANSGTKNVSVIDTADNTIKATVAMPDTQQTLHPYAYSVAVGASGQKVYVGLQSTNEIYIFDSFTKTQLKRISLGGDSPGGLAVNAAETRLYVTSNMSNTLIVIDISGVGAAEVGRVMVDDAVVSNPDGVVINSDATRAYVASTMTGKIAKIDLNEATNVYTRLSVTALGENVQPVGLALSADGNKLYVSSLIGAVKMIDTSDMSIDANLSGGNGTVTVALKPDGTRIYAPSNSLDKLYVFNGSNAPLGDFSVIPGPYSASVTPDNSKLYITMHTPTGNTVKVLNTSDNSEAATITLPVGARPTSMGNFIGPELPFIISASAGGNCAITPAGDVPMNGVGSRKFTVIATVPTACDVKVDGNMQEPGVTTSYQHTFSNVTASHSITAFPVGTTFTVTASWTGEPAGCLEIPATSACVAQNTPIAFNAGSRISISANNTFKAEAWTGACAGTTTDTCILTINSDKIVGANIVVGGGPVYNLTKGTYPLTLAAATQSLLTASSDIIKISTVITSDTTTGTPGNQVTLSSQWDKNTNYTAKGLTHVPLTLTITDVAVIAGVPGDATSTLVL